MPISRICDQIFHWVIKLWNGKSWKFDWFHALQSINKVWLRLSWQSSCFPHQRFAVWIQSYWNLFIGSLLILRSLKSITAKVPFAPLKGRELVNWPTWMAKSITNKNYIFKSWAAAAARLKCVQTGLGNTSLTKLNLKSVIKLLLKLSLLFHSFGIWSYKVKYSQQ